MMAIWQHSECSSYVDNPGIPVGCPYVNIPNCINPTAGFNQIRENVWECKSCKWLVVGSEPPSSCPSVNALPCENTEGGEFEKICD